eukprot:6176862-Pleurochrysis_carterae.AAC.1
MQFSSRQQAIFKTIISFRDQKSCLLGRRVIYVASKAETSAARSSRRRPKPPEADLPYPLTNKLSNVLLQDPQGLKTPKIISRPTLTARSYISGLSTPLTD